MPDLNELRAALETARHELGEKQALLLEAEIAELRPRQKDLRARCRVALEEYERLAGRQAGDHTEPMLGEIKLAAFENHNADMALSTARAALRHVHRLPPYPTDAEIEAVQNHRKALNEMVSAAVTRTLETDRLYRQLFAEGKMAAEAFQQVQQEYDAVSATLARMQGELWQLKPSLRPPPIDVTQYDNLTYVIGGNGQFSVEVPSTRHVVR